MTAELFRERLGGSRRAVKVALLDQRAVAGIGNLYASEILHLADIHPARSVRQDYASANGKRLPMRRTRFLETAIRYEGSTLGDGTYRNALNQAGELSESSPRVRSRGRSVPALWRRVSESCESCRPSGRRSFARHASENVQSRAESRNNFASATRDFALIGMQLAE